MEFEETRFRFYRHTKGNKKKGTFKVLNEGWLNYADYTTPRDYPDTKMGEVYKIHYSNGTLTIDENEIDVDLAKSIVVDKEVKKGDIIGFTGSTGNSYQGKKMNHLHFGVSLAGVPQHPYETLKEYIGLDASGETNTKQDGTTRSSEW